MKLLKFIILGIYFSVCLIFFSGCKQHGNKQESNKSRNNDTEARRKAEAIISARTMGLAYLEDNNLDSAQKEFQKLIGLDPGQASGYANLGIIDMRMGNLETAEEHLKKAVSLSPDDPDIRLNLAKVYDLMNNEKKSREEMDKALSSSPEHIRTLYSMAESYEKHADKYSMEQWEKYLRKIVSASPGNIAARLHLEEVLVGNDKADEALANLEEIGKQSPSFPDDAVKYYRSSLKYLQASDVKNALVSVKILHNLLKLTGFYQAALRELRGSVSSATVGNPVFTFNQPAAGIISPGESILGSLHFTDATVAAGLAIVPDTTLNGEVELLPVTHISLADMDRDGDEDIYLGTYDCRNGSYKSFLLRNELGRYENITRQAGIGHTGKEFDSEFADYDNDGFLDLFILREGSDILYFNISEGKFQDVTSRSGTGDPHGGHKVLFLDMDQDGDLDLFLGAHGNRYMYRNNGDGTFTDVTPETGLGGNSGILDAEMADFDDDGDIDLFMIDEAGRNLLYSNVRQGRFINVTENSNLKNEGGSRVAASADYNNDGFTDILTLSEGSAPCRLFKNNGDGSFNPDHSSDSAFAVLSHVLFFDARFFDFDNDGYQDLLVAGKAAQAGRKGVFLFHNNGRGQFENVSGLLPGNLYSGRQIAIADYNEDGDMDIFLTGIYGGVRLLRNDGGDLNHHLKVQMVGLRTGSSKNNYFGIGSKVEVRAGDLYQMKTITNPEVHFGLGNRDKADVVRILWTNGVSQNIFSPGSDKDLVEQQELKGSCPFLYTWDGRAFVFQKDMMWRSALGMPMGIMGGTTAYAFPDASDEYIKIPGDQLRASGGQLKMQITAELWEAIYFDKLELIAVDHPKSVDPVVDEKFIPPPFPPLKIYEVGSRGLPVSATDANGVNLRDLITKKDDHYISNLMHSRYQGITEIHDLILDLGKITSSDSITLFLNGWIFPTDASINYALSQSDEYKVIPPMLQVRNRKGEWETAIKNIGFPMGKNKTVVVDLSGIFQGNDRQVRIRTNMEIYWDYIYYTVNPQTGRMRLTPLNPATADLQYRGFSAEYRKDGRYGPHWFDYDQVTMDPKWRDLTGNYTRYGNVLPLLINPDNQYVIMNAGDEVTVSFEDSSLPVLPKDWVRDYLIHSVGWVKDGDLNTASGQTVSPLPYHGMKQYPYSGGGIYVTDPDLIYYLKIYNTRSVTDDSFNNQLRVNNR